MKKYNEPPKTKCDEIGFEHAWEDITPQEVYFTNPPQYPPRIERCKNCGLIRKLIIEKKNIGYMKTLFKRDDAIHR